MSNGSPTVHLLWAILASLVSTQNITTRADRLSYFWDSFLDFWYAISGAMTGFNVSDGIRGGNRVHSSASWRWVDRPKFTIPFESFISLLVKLLQYTYVVAMPLLLLFSVGMAVLKYREGQLIYHWISISFLNVLSICRLLPTTPRRS